MTNKQNENLFVIKTIKNVMEYKNEMKNKGECVNNRLLMVFYLF